LDLARHLLPRRCRFDRRWSRGHLFHSRHAH
jgi:hypothetical protein